MKEYEYIVEIYAEKTLHIKANSEEEADRQADLITTTETIPVTQDDIVEIRITDAYEYEREKTEYGQSNVPVWPYK